MNDLEPWKIWAVTAVLVCFIMGVAAERVRPIEVGGSIAQASTLTPDERATTVTAEPSQPTDQYEAYAPCTSHRTYGGAEGFGTQVSTVISVGSLAAGSAAPSGRLDEYDQAPELDVTQQLINEDNAPDLLLATNEGQLLTGAALGWTDTIDSSAVDLADDTATTGLQFTDTYNVTSQSGDAVVFFDASGTGEVRVANLSIQNAVVDMVLTDANSSEAQIPVQLSHWVFNTAVSQTQAFDGELDADYSGDTAPQDLDELRTQAIEAQAMIQAKMEADQTARQRAAYIYSLSGASAKWQVLAAP